jgi:hypothetical protein
MFKNILIFSIIFALIVLIVFDDKNDYTGTENVNEKFSNINEQVENIILNENNFTMSDNSIIMSQNTNLTKDECLNKVNKSDIKGASYNLENNTCTLYFFAEKGLSNKNFESIILK